MMRKFEQNIPAESPESEDFDVIFEKKKKAVKQTAKELLDDIENSGLSDEAPEKQEYIDSLVEKLKDIDEDPVWYTGFDAEKQPIGKGNLYSKLLRWGESLFDQMDIKQMPDGKNPPPSALKLWETYKNKIMKEHHIFVNDKVYNFNNFYSSQHHLVFEGRDLTQGDALAHKVCVVTKIVKLGYSPMAGSTKNEEDITFFAEKDQKSTFKKSHVVIDVMTRSEHEEAQKKYQERIKNLLSKATQKKSRKTTDEQKIIQEEQPPTEKKETTATKPIIEEIPEKKIPDEIPPIETKEETTTTTPEEVLTNEEIAEKQKELSANVQNVHKEIFPILKRIDLSHPSYKEAGKILDGLRSLIVNISELTPSSATLEDQQNKFLELLDNLDSLSEKI